MINVAVAATITLMMLLLEVVVFRGETGCFVLNFLKYVLGTE